LAWGSALSQTGVPDGNIDIGGHWPRLVMPNRNCTESSLTLQPS
jgi:hypothetical protein